MSQLRIVVNVVNVSVSDPTSLTSIQTKLLKLFFEVIDASKSLSLQIQRYVTPIFRVLLQSVKKICSGMATFLILGQEQFSNEIQLHVEKNQKIYSRVLSFFFVLVFL